MSSIRELEAQAMEHLEAMKYHRRKLAEHERHAQAALLRLALQEKLETRQAMKQIHQWRYNREQGG